VQSGAPASRRSLPGMPFEMDDPDDEDGPRSGNRKRFGEQTGPWWRPASTVGRVFLGVAALAVMATVTAAYVSAKTYLSRDSRFRITGAGNIDATGLTEISRAQMLPVFGEDMGRNIFFVPLNERRKQLEAIPWVQRATVMRLLPDRIRVSVVERQPVAFVRQGQQVGLVDANGVLLSMPAATMAQHHYSFPVVTGLNAHDSLADRSMRMAVYERLLADLDSNHQHLSEQISEIDLIDPQDARILMPEQGSDILAHLGDDKFLDRYQRYKSHIADWRQQYPKIVAVDLRYDNQVVLEMPPGTDAVAAAVGSDGAIQPSLVAAPPPSSAAALAKPSAGTARSEASVEHALLKPHASTRPPSTAMAAKPLDKPQETSHDASTPSRSTSAPRTLASTAKSGSAKAVSAKATRARQNAVELLAAKQRAARERAAKAKALREKKEEQKKRAAAEHAVLHDKKSSPTRSVVAEGL
jgi:cell division protein FtsQ